MAGSEPLFWRSEIRYRQSADLLTDADRASFSAAMTRAMSISDNRGYAYFAKMHGWEHWWCKHHDPEHFFLPWHRAYLYMIERGLSDLAGREIALPWWDWTKPLTASGLPTLFEDPALGLDSAPLDLPPSIAAALRRDAPHLVDFNSTPPRTARAPDPAARLPAISEVKQVLQAPTFNDFSEQLEDLHDRVHGWFNRTMSAVVLAAFDPIFWAHHTMIDRIWYLWQLRHPGAVIAPELLDRAMEGFPLTFRQVLKIEALGYDYASTVIE